VRPKLVISRWSLLRSDRPFALALASSTQARTTNQATSAKFTTAGLTK